MKKVAILLISLGLFASCVHKHNCACGASNAMCSSCEQTDGSNSDSCVCDKK